MSSSDNGREQRRDVFRETAVRSIPSWYSPMTHLLCSGGLCLGAAVYAMLRITSFGTAEAVTTVSLLLALNVFEWWTHAKLMHEKRPLLNALYTKHTRYHHRIYLWKDMAIRDTKEWYFVLIPFAVIVQLIVLSLVVVLLTAWLFGGNIAWLLLAVEGVYVACYEVVHLLYHAPRTSLAGRSRLIRRLAEHHARHHDPKLMQRWNFNITVPLADKMFGTVVPDEILEERRRTRNTP